MNKGSAVGFRKQRNVRTLGLTESRTAEKPGEMTPRKRKLLIPLRCFVRTSTDHTAILTLKGQSGYNGME